MCIDVYMYDIWGDGKMIQWLREMADPTKDPGSISSTHIVIPSYM